MISAEESRFTIDLDSDGKRSRIEQGGWHQLEYKVSLGPTSKLQCSKPEYANGIFEKDINFSFQVTDDGGTADGGQDTDQTPNVINIGIRPVNDPGSSDKTITIPKNTSYTFSHSDFTFSDIDGDTIKYVELSTNKGNLTLNGEKITHEDRNGQFTPIKENYNDQVTDVMKGVNLVFT